MEEALFYKLYNFDKKRLYSNFERIRNLNAEFESSKVITKFLINQSIGNSPSQISEILTYFQGKLSNDKELLDFAFEWIRANKIRLEYKKYITLNDYKAYTTALDDAIFLFFQRYDELLRSLFVEEMKEHEFSTLYQIFFNPKPSDNVNLTPLLEQNESKVLTIILDGERIDTKIHTLRNGLSDMIKNDYNDSLPSDKQIIIYEKKDFKEEGIERNFDGTMIERLIKFYCFQKTKIDKKEFTLAINQFLSSYFQFSLFYEFNQFKDNLISSLAEFIYSGLTKDYENFSPNKIKDEIYSILEEFQKNLKQVRLKGKAWIEDLKPILLNFIEEFVERLK